MTSRHIDHLVVAVRDLDGATRLYERLGFVVGAKNRHPWGTENRLVQFQNSYLELISVGEGAEIPPDAPRSFSFGDFEPFYFSRRGRRPDGAEAEVAFTLAFARDADAPDAGFFVCQHHHPGNF